ncbi:hypothetical protein B7494_g4316 [Chlorociboria aeruginascens]|nr:hypothetical protein B7494_g4316 [Chlorociboria aeruginascens]
MDEPTDDFKGFGEGFDGFPRRLPEDCAEYTLFILDSKLKSQKEVLGRLETVRKAASKLTDNLLKEYIWQRDSFRLDIESGKGVIYLHGLTNYGDSVEDEWLIVYILKELSNHFPELWIKIVDTDGEFLLIEAANALPRWLNPEIADNRIWINQNKLRIIPLTAAAAASSTRTAPVSRSLSLEEAWKMIVSSPDTLMNSPLIEAEAFYRLRNYPSQVASSLHYSPTTIPRKLAYILHDRPASIAPAVEAFYLRDPIALKPLQTNSSALVFPPEDLVTVSTRFTKVLFAQVKSQQFSAPAAWKDILFKAATNSGSDVVVRKEHEQLEIGMKVTSGFEMLVNDPTNSDNRAVREIKILLEDINSDETFLLPTDEEISSWKDVRREDDEKWLDINFEDFERELQGGNRKKKESQLPGVFGPESPSGFGDTNTQADLKKMVERFEAFLNDEDAGIDGAELDDMDFDDDEELDEDSVDEDKDVSFDEKEFTRMMREMMGMPTEEDEAQVDKPKDEKSGELDEIDTEEEDDDIRNVMQRMEAELNEAGALNLDPTPTKLIALKGKTAIAPSNQDLDDGSDGEVDIDFDLAKNLLESFKSQAGVSGPGGNLMGMMGIQLPRDEADPKQARKT